MNNIAFVKTMQNLRKHIIKRKLKVENYKNCLEATQFENKINYPGKNKINIGSL